MPPPTKSDEYYLAAVPRLVSILCLSAALVLGPGASESTAASMTPYEVDYVADGAIVASSVGLLLVWGLGVGPTLRANLRCKQTNSGTCDPASLSSTDRYSVGRKAEGWAFAGDVVQTGSMGVAVLAAGLDAWLADTPTPMADVSTDVLVTLESITLATLANEAVRYAVARPRPREYGAGRSGERILARGSFPSGHTMATSAAATSYATTFALRHPDSPWRYAVAGGAAALIGIAGYGRVADGQHFASDVVAGALVGAAFGFGVPLLHRRQASLTVAPMIGAGGARAWQIAFEERW